jgi:uncharacterized protein (TIGR02145 family)
MKRKILNSILIYFGLIVLIFQSCGPNKEQIAKQKTQDSLNLITAKEQKGEIIWTEDKHGYFVDLRDNNKYKVVKIGTQTWMAENLAYKTNIGCWAYDNDTTNVAKYGYLYDWETAKKVAPTGWHLPTDVEWASLTTNVGGENIAGRQLKSTTGWAGVTAFGSEANNSGFTALPGGGKDTNGAFSGIGYYGYWWSSTEGRSNSAWSRLMTVNDEIVVRGDNIVSLGFSVRCIRDN